MSELYRVVNDEQGLQLDFMPRLDGMGLLRRLCELVAAYGREGP